MLISQIITNFYLLDLFIFCTSVLLARIYAYHRSVWCSWRSEDSISVGNRTQVLCVSTKHSLSHLCSPVKPSYGIGALLAMLTRRLINLFKNESAEKFYNQAWAVSCVPSGVLGGNLFPCLSQFLGPSRPWQVAPSSPYSEPATRHSDTWSFVMSHHTGGHFFAFKDLCD